MSFLSLCLHWKLRPESLRTEPPEKCEPQPGPQETHENKRALTCLSAQEKVSGSGPSVALAWVKRVSRLPSYHESLAGEEKVRCRVTTLPTVGCSLETDHIMPTKGKVQPQPEKEPTVVHPVCRGSRKACQGCAPRSAVQNITCGEPHRPSPHPPAARTRLLHRALLANLWGRLGPRRPSQCSITPPGRSSGLCAMGTAAPKLAPCWPDNRVYSLKERWASAALPLSEPAGANPQAASLPCLFSTD